MGQAQQRSRFLPDEQALARLAQRLATDLSAPLVLYLRGDLGAGKTTFARAFIHALGYPGRVKSPSYGLLETYCAGGLLVLHLDLYRIEDVAEIEYLALRDLFAAQTILMVEWPEKGSGYLPLPDLELHFSELESGRHVEIRSFSSAGQGRLSALNLGQ